MIELLVVVVIISILPGVALPNFPKQRDIASISAANAQAAALMSACEITIINDVADLTSECEIVRLKAADEADYPSEATDIKMDITVTNTTIEDNPDTSGVDESAERGCIIAISGSPVSDNGTFTSFSTKTPAS